MTPEKLNEIKARADRATPGPWTLDEDYRDKEITGGVENTYLDSRTGKRRLAYIWDTDTKAGKNDAEFIAHARTDIPALLQVIEILQAENQMLVSACQNVLEDAKARPGAYLYADLTALRIAVEEDQ